MVEGCSVHDAGLHLLLATSYGLAPELPETSARSDFETSPTHRRAHLDQPSSSKFDKIWPRSWESVGQSGVDLADIEPEFVQLSPQLVKMAPPLRGTCSTLAPGRILELCLPPQGRCHGE